ncbi:restriction endonuclease [Streptosporangium sp. NPDC087985]|uniref:restriction endonuclease n=1 Tax=Streptosporangium sp. NPDC087985 TaxID=3366196 RepID=UPI0038303BF1
MQHNISGYEFERLVESILKYTLKGYSIETPTSREDAGVDLIARKGDEVIAFEVKATTPQTSTRLRKTVEQLKHYEERFREKHPNNPTVELTLVIPTALTSEHIDYLSSQNVKVMDGEEIARQASRHGLQNETVRVLGNLAPDPESRAITRRLANIYASKHLLEGLNDTPCGTQDWVKYQKLCRDILEYLFCPPLESPITEHATQLKSNRRDIILPNYCLDGYFAYLRTVYQAHLIVFDAKNSCKGITKSDVLQISNYMSDKGLGLFGALVGRKRANKSAHDVRREHWKEQGKLILFLEDDDLRQMIQLKISSQDPIMLIMQKIEDFRLSN